MLIPEACQLILQAMSQGNGGEIFVLDMGDPIKITFLAEQLIRLSGKIIHKDIQIKFTGLRPGEKLFEELFHEKELLQKTNHPKIFMARHRASNEEALNVFFDEMALHVNSGNEAELLRLLKAIVPDFHQGDLKERVMPSSKV